jgi:hypothetical protein
MMFVGLGVWLSSGRAKLQGNCSFPFKGKARMGMGSLSTTTPIPTPTLPLKGREWNLQFLIRVP